MSQDLDYFSAVIDEFHEALWAVDDNIERHDIADPLLQVLGNPLPDPAVLAALDDRRLEQLRDEYRAWLEVETIETDHLRQALSRLQARWP